MTPERDTPPEPDVEAPPDTGEPDADDEGHQAPPRENGEPRPAHAFAVESGQVTYDR